MFLLLLAPHFLSAQLTTLTYNYTGAVQTFVVPSCETFVTVDVQGASGGNLGTAIGGKGGRVQATIPVSPGDVLSIYVGQAGRTDTNAFGGFNGGGAVFSYAHCDSAGTGGGASDIRLNGTSFSNIVVIAGGGGGAGGASSPVQYLAGGNGGGLTGVDGSPWNSWPNSGGKGGTPTAGGAAGIACCSCPQYTTSGTQLNGGNGTGDCAGGGGGGGGYYGGGGSCFGGAGGGSSFTGTGVTSVTHTQGYRTGDGIVTLTYTSCTGIAELPHNVSVNVFPNPFGSSITLFVSESGCEASIYNMIGSSCANWKLASGNNILDTKDLPAGAYIVQVRTSTGITSKKMIKVN